MTDEEKAVERYCKTCKKKNNCFHNCDVFIEYTKGLAEGRKEIERLKKDCSIWESRAKGLLHKNEMVDVYGLQKENAELKKENERLKSIIETPCTSCCITENLEQSLEELNDQVVNQDGEIRQLKAQIENLKMVTSSWIMSLMDIKESKVNDRRGEVLKEIERRMEKLAK